MAELPLDPCFGRVLLKSADSDCNCLEDVLSIIAMLSVDSVFYTPHNKKKEAEQARKLFISLEVSFALESVS